jgi:DNA modification methylase
MMYELYLGDCLVELKKLADESVDSIVTDPPAGISFMGKKWDSDKGGRTVWVAWMTEVATECLRVLKPGGHAFVWAIPRTSHWTGWAWEDAGFEARDKVYHLFGTGFPKSHNVSKAIDKQAGAEREVVGRKDGERYKYDFANTSGKFVNTRDADKSDRRNDIGNITAPATEEAKTWDGWGTALKPAAEEWWLFRKPFNGTVASNVLQYGTGAINIDGCRVPLDGEKQPAGSAKRVFKSNQYTDEKIYGDNKITPPEGRFPANLIHNGSDEVVSMFPETKKAGNKKASDMRNGTSVFGIGQIMVNPEIPGDNGGSAARFFYCAKASRSERNEGLIDPGPRRKRNDTTGGKYAEAPNPIGSNTHCTVKPLALMRYLCRMITPPNGIVVDPFMGSGTTGCACAEEGFRFIGIEMEEDSFQIAERRIEHWYNKGKNND